MSKRCTKYKMCQKMILSSYNMLEIFAMKFHVALVVNLITPHDCLH